MAHQAAHAGHGQADGVHVVLPDVRALCDAALE
jgi:hypothetical protein